MRVVQSSLARAAVLALMACGSAQAQALLDTVPAYSQAFVNAGYLAPLAYANDGAASGTVLSTSSTSLRGFDADLGVLVGASFSLGLVNDGAGLLLRTYVPESGAKTVTASLSASWQLLGSGLAAPIASVASTTLISYVPVLTGPNDPSTLADTAQWARTSLQAEAASLQLNGLVGADRLITSQLDSTLSVARVDPDKTKGRAEAYLTDSSNAAVFGALTGTAQYSFLQHGSASVMFDGAAASEVYLSNGRTTAQITLVAQGSADTTTGLDFSGLAADFRCEGACDRFALDLPAGFSGLAAGDEIDVGTVQLLGEEGNFSATYTLTLADTAGVGASASQRSNTLSFVVESGVVSAVPEAKTPALLLSGLGILGWLGRRRARAPSAITSH